MELRAKWLENHFNDSENMTDIDKAPDCARTSVSLDSPNCPTRRLADLAAHPVSQFNLSEEEEDSSINDALQALHTHPASEHTAKDSVNKCAQLSILVATLNSRFNAYNNPSDFEKAIYIAVECAFWCVDHYTDMDEGCTLASKSLAVLYLQDKPKYLSEMGLAFENRLEHSMSPSTGKRLRDFHLAVHFGQLAIKDIPDSHANGLRYAANLQHYARYYSVWTQ